MKYFIIMNFLFLSLSCNQNSDHIDGPTIGKYKNVVDSSYLFIYFNKTYKIVRDDTTFKGQWVFIVPNEIGFKNWKDQNRGILDYKFGIVKEEAIIFDLDNENNNYYLETK